MVKTWNIRKLLPEAENTYRTLEKQFDVSLYYPIPLRRYCQNADDVKRLGRRMRNPRYAGDFGRFLPVGSAPCVALDHYGSIEILNAAYVDLPLVQKTIRDFFRKVGCFRDGVFNYSDLSRLNGHWTYEGSVFDNVIFAEGVGICANPWFQYLPMRPAKGETLVVSGGQALLPRVLLHHKKWILPYEDGTSRIGATYDDQGLTTTPTEAAGNELLKAANEFLISDVNLTVEEHLAGIRPGTVDARPLLGEHPDEAGLYVFNGLGAKGASSAPEMSLQLVEHILRDSPLDSEISIRRF